MMNPLLRSDPGLAFWSILILAILILGIVLIVVLFRRSTGNTVVPGRSRRPRPRPVIVRIICGLIGIGILVALGIRSLREAPGVHASFHFPTKSSPNWARPTDDTISVERTRWLFQFIFFNNNFPVHAEEVEIRLPEDSGRTIIKTGNKNTLPVEVNLTLGSSSVSHYGSLEPILRGRYYIQLHDGMNSGGYSGDLRWLIPWEEDNINPARIQCLGGNSRIDVFCLAHKVAFDDPLKKVNLYELVQSMDWNDWRFSPIKRRLVFDLKDPAGIRLMHSMGFSFTLMVLAAILLAQCFARRGLAFSGMLLLCVLYVAALDRAVLAKHVSKLEDKNLSLETRLIAAESLNGTFFYCNAAEKALNRAVNDATLPEFWRRSMILWSHNLKALESR
jgi:hypothetical protein